MMIPFRMNELYKESIRRRGKELESDVCSMAPDIFWYACVEHDIHYRTHRTIAGEPLSREDADHLFWLRAKQHGVGSPCKAMAASVYYVAIRAFGWRAWAKGGKR